MLSSKNKLQYQLKFEENTFPVKNIYYFGCCGFRNFLNFSERSKSF